MLQNAILWQLSEIGLSVSSQQSNTFTVNRKGKMGYGVGIGMEFKEKRYHYFRVGREN